MLKDRTLMGGLALLLVGVLVIFAIWFFVLRTPQAASEPIQSIPLATLAPTAVPRTPEAAGSGDAGSNADNPVETATAVIETAEASDPPAETVESEEPETETAVNATQVTIFEIVQSESETRFILDELLRGIPTNVVGVTNQVAGQIAANFADLSTAQVGIIQINTRTLATDNNLRNNAIRNRILFTDQFEFITFVPTQIRGLPDSVAIGETITFQITGDLTIKNITQSETFQVTAVPVSPTRLQGSATTTIARADYQLVIPPVANVANVDEEVVLEIEFVAEAITSE